MPGLVYTSGQKVRFDFYGKTITGTVSYQHPRHDVVVIHWYDSSGVGVRSSFSVRTKKMHCPLPMPDDPYLLD